VKSLPRLELDESTICKRCNRFAEARCDGMLGQPRIGRPRIVNDVRIEELITTLETAPENATHWSTRSMAEHLRLSQFDGFAGRPDPRGSTSYKRWFAELTTEKLRRGTHTWGRQLNLDIRVWIATWNDNSFTLRLGAKIAEQILDTIGDYCRRINGSGHQPGGARFYDQGAPLGQASRSAQAITHPFRSPAEAMIWA
jgi:hypothetical protein